MSSTASRNYLGLNRVLFKVLSACTISALLAMGGCWDIQNGDGADGANGTDVSGPRVPSLPRPPDAARDVVIQDGAIELGWTSSGAEKYQVHLQWWNLGDNHGPFREFYPKVSKITVEGMEYGKTYYWDVNAFRAGETAFGPLWSFTTMSTPLPETDVFVRFGRIIVPGATIVSEGIMYDGDDGLRVEGLVGILKDDEPYLYHTSLGDVDLSEVTSRHAVGQFMNDLYGSTGGVAKVFMRSLPIGTMVTADTGVEIEAIDANTYRVTNVTNRWVAVKGLDEVVFLMPEGRGVDTNLVSAFRQWAEGEQDLAEILVFNEERSRDIAVGDRAVETYGDVLGAAAYVVCSISLLDDVSEAWNKDSALYARLNAVGLIHASAEAAKRIGGPFDVTDCIDNTLIKATVDAVEAGAIGLLTGDQTYRDQFADAIGDDVVNGLATCAASKIIPVAGTIVSEVLDIIALGTWLSDTLWDATWDTCTHSAYDEVEGVSPSPWEGLGDLAGGSFRSEASAVSGDSSVVVGTSESASGMEAYRWTRQAGMAGLGDLPGGQFDSRASGASADGSVVVGWSDSEEGREIEAFRWTTGSGLQPLGFIGEGYGGSSLFSQAYDASGDGSVIVGESSSVDGDQAFRWTASSGMVGLGDLPGGPFGSSAFAVSADGSVIVGRSASSSGSEAFRWTASSGMVGLGDFSGGSFFSAALAVSDDGSIVVGFGTTASGPQAFRWTASTGMVGLGDLPGGEFNSGAQAVSADGSVVGGISYTSLGPQAFIWDETHGMRNLREVLVNEFGLDLSGWDLEGLSGISSDEKTLVGWGTNPDGHPEGWIATVP